MPSNFTIGGSEIGTLLGLNPYQTPMDLFMRKLNLIEPEPDNEFKKWGRDAEHVLARRYARETGAVLLPSVDEGFDHKNPMIHPQYPFWTGTPDRLIDPDGLLEIKIVGERASYLFGEAPDGEIPESYLVQIHWYLGLTNRKYADLAVQISNREYRVYRINRDLALEDNLMEAAQDFLNNHLIPGIPPRIDASESSRTYLHKIFPRETEDWLESNHGINLWAEMLRQARADIKIEQLREAKAENKLKELIGSHIGVQGDWGRISWKANKNGLRIFRPVFKDEEEVDNG